MPGGVSNVGFGAELSRRKGDFEVQFGLEYEKLTVTPGPWVEKDKPIMGGSVDHVRDDGFGWVTAELSFMYHTPIIAAALGAVRRRRRHRHPDGQRAPHRSVLPHQQPRLVRWTTPVARTKTPRTTCRR